jgi:hypothetical protein
MNKETELILEAYSKINEVLLVRRPSLNPMQDKLLKLLQPVISKFVEDNHLHSAVNTVLLNQLSNIGEHVQWIKHNVVNPANIDESEKAPMQIEFESGNKKIKLSTVRKVETDEWLVKVYVDGKYDEGKTYYTDDKEDAIATMKEMAKDSTY